MKILVCGSREWRERKAIERELASLANAYHGKFAIIHGDCRGADKMAGAVARQMGLPEFRVPANWFFFGKPAGVIRNQWMLEYGEPDLVLAFHENLEESKGTKDMVERARRAGVEVKVFAE